MKFKRSALMLSFIAFYSLPAHAYLDPGTGSIVIQSLIAAVAAGALIIKTYWYKIRSFFDKPAKEVEPIAEDTENNNATG